VTFTLGNVKHTLFFYSSENERIAVQWRKNIYYALFDSKKNHIICPAQYVRFVDYKRYLFNVTKLPHLLYGSYKKRKKKHECTYNIHTIQSEKF